MKTLTKYENLTGKEVKIVHVPFFDEEDGIMKNRLGIQMFDYVSSELVNNDERDIIQIFVDYVNQFREISTNQLNSLCERFVEVYWYEFSKEAVLKEFGI